MPRKKKAQLVWWVDSPDIRYSGTAAQAIEIIESEMNRSLELAEGLDLDLDDQFARDMRWVARDRSIAEEHLSGRGWPLFLYEGELKDATIISEDSKTGWTLVLVPHGGPKGKPIDYSRDYMLDMMSADCRAVVTQIVDDSAVESAQ